MEAVSRKSGQRINASNESVLFLSSSGWRRQELLHHCSDWSKWKRLQHVNQRYFYEALRFAVKCPSKLSGTRCFANVEKDDIHYSAKRDKSRSVDIVTSATSSLHWKGSTGFCRWKWFNKKPVYQYERGAKIDTIISIYTAYSAIKEKNWMPPRNHDFLDKRDISWNHSSHQTSITLHVSLRYNRTS